MRLLYELPLSAAVLQLPLSLWSDPTAVHLRDYQDVFYSCELLVAGKALRVLLDTGSSNLWLKEQLVTTAERSETQAHVVYGMGDVPLGGPRPY